MAEFVFSSDVAHSNREIGRSGWKNCLLTSPAAGPAAKMNKQLLFALAPTLSLRSPCDPSKSLDEVKFE